MMLVSNWIDVGAELDNFSTSLIFLQFLQLTTLSALPTAGSDTELKMGLRQSRERV